MFAVAKTLASELGIDAPWVASLRDVPGTTRSLIPHLVRNQIRALTIGVNDFSPSPLLPNPGVWVEPNSNASIIIMRTPQGIGYPDNAGSDPLHPGGLSRDSCVTPPALPDSALCWMFRTDNSGPPESIEEVLRYFEIVRWQFPGADVFASTHEAFVAELERVRDQLPVTSSEAGETWLTGVPSDPWKVVYVTHKLVYTFCFMNRFLYILFHPLLPPGTTCEISIFTEISLFFFHPLLPPGTNARRFVPTLSVLPMLNV